MSEQIFTITSSDGTGIVGSLWQPKRKAKALLLWLHGFAEHRQRYDRFARWLSDNGIAVGAIDYRGHGESEGRKGHVRRFEDYFRDLAGFFHWSLETFPRTKVVLGSHSLGSLIAARFMQRGALPRPVEALVMTGPFFAVGQPVPAWKERVGRLAARIAPGLGIPAAIAPERLNHDAQNVSAYAHDPLVFKKATAGWYREVVQAQSQALKDASQITQPLLLIQGMEDQLVSPAVSRSFFDRTGTRAKDKKWIGAEALYHEVLNEPQQKEEFYKEILKWIRKYT